MGGPASCASQGHDMLDFIASPGAPFSDEDAMWWRGHVLGTTSQTHLVWTQLQSCMRPRAHAL